MYEEIITSHWLYDPDTFRWRKITIDVPTAFWNGSFVQQTHRIGSIRGLDDW